MSVPVVPLSEVASINPPLNQTECSYSVAFVEADEVVPTAWQLFPRKQDYPRLPSQCGFFQTGDLLLPSNVNKLAIGAVCQVNMAASYGYYLDHLLTLRANPGYLDARFLQHFLRQRHMAGKVAQWLATQGSRKGPSRPFLQQLPLPLPALATQREQVARLAHAHQQCTDLEAELLRLNNQRRMLFRKFFGSTLDLEEQLPAIPMEELLSGWAMGAPAIEQAEGDARPGLPLIHTVHLGVARLCKTAPMHVPFDEPQPDRWQAQTNDVLLATHANAGHAAVCPFPLVFGPDIAMLRPRQGELLPGYLASYLASGTGIGAVARLFGESHRQKIGLEDLMVLPVYKPPLAMQAAFVDEAMASLPEIDAVELQWWQARKQVAELENQFFGER